MDLRQSDLWDEYMDSIGWQIDKLQNHFIFTLELFRIRISKLPRFEKNLDIEKADLFFKDKGSLLLKLEPNFPAREIKIPEIEKYGYLEDKWPLAPTKTIVIDLTQPLELLTNLKNKRNDRNLCFNHPFWSYRNDDFLEIKIQIQTVFGSPVTK